MFPFHRGRKLPPMQIDKAWTQFDFVAFDTETSGAWPVGCDIVEFGAVKWRAGQEVDRLQLLIRPREKMTDFIIGIHGITNEMVAQAPSISEVMPQIANFLKGSVLMAHHAPFDMGFVAYEFEKSKMDLPDGPALCTSLLARQLIRGTENHKLQTLVKFLGLDGGAAHRALDDAKACLQVGLHCLRQLGEQAPLAEAIRVQGKKLEWPSFLIRASGDPLLTLIADAVESKSILEFTYDKSTLPRQAKPLGLVRSPDGDFMQAHCFRDNSAKRFYLEKVHQARARQQA